MEKRQIGLIATIATVLCCGLPGCASLCFGATFALAGGIPGAEIDMFGSSDPAAAIGTGIALLCGGIIFIAIPVVVGFLTLRKKPAAVETPDSSEPFPPAS